MPNESATLDAQSKADEQPAPEEAQPAEGGRAPGTHSTDAEKGEGAGRGAAPPPEPPTAEETKPEPPTPSNKRWYVVKVQSGREESIKDAIERRVKIEGLEVWVTFDNQGRSNFRNIHIPPPEPNGDRSS